MFVGETLLSDLVGLVVALLLIVIGYYKWAFLYWTRRKVPYLEPEIPFGNLKEALRGKEHIATTFKKIYNEMKSRGWKYGGIYTFTTPMFFPLDLDLIRNILTKDFEYFTDREHYYNEKDPHKHHLLNLTGAKWKNLRAKLSPTFTSGKIKTMFNIMAECQNGLVERMDQECLKNKPIDIKEVLACFATNIIGSCAFGLEFKALEDEDSEFRSMGKIMFTSPRLLRYKRIFCFTFPKVAKFLKVSLAEKELDDFITNMVEKTIDYREKNNYRRNDFMQTLIDLKNEPLSDDGEHFTLDKVTSQVIVFYAAGFETSSTLMTFVMYHLSKNQKIQNKVRYEINSVLARHNNQITYDSVQQMTYLSQVIDETFRIHPPAPTLNRKCIKDYKLPNEDVVIEKDTIVKISLLGVYYDEEYYPDPTKFDPDRFSEENKKKRHNYAHLPFGEGPRNCIGLRFGLLQSKMGLVSLIKNYRFTINNKTEEPLTFEPKSIIVNAKGGIWLNAQKL